jgi:hypothetical protein
VLPKIGVNTGVPPWRAKQYDIVGAHVVIFNDKHEILLVSERPGKPYGLPGGKLDWGESIQDGLKRELAEEGFHDVIQCGYTWYSPGGNVCCVYTFARSYNVDDWVDCKWVSLWDPWESLNKENLACYMHRIWESVHHKITTQDVEFWEASDEECCMQDTGRGEQCFSVGYMLHVEVEDYFPPLEWVD